jgi:hypothetical protein
VRGPLAIATGTGGAVAAAGSDGRVGRSLSNGVAKRFDGIIGAREACSRGQALQQHSLPVPATVAQLLLADAATAEQ